MPLKADIREHGILCPLIVDEADRILDGVHRARIAAELGIEPPVARHEGLSEERKLHLAVGLNMRRRHLDADRRRALVRRLHAEEGLSLRRIAAVTGWSKSTVERDLRTSPFEESLRAARAAATTFAELDIVSCEGCWYSPLAMAPRSSSRRRSASRAVPAESCRLRPSGSVRRTT
jgi:ParB-like chromosome segregation protein Spo0J